MNNWTEYRIEECCDILDRLRVPLNAEAREGMAGNIPYCGANGVQGYIDKYIFDEDLILIAEDGGNFEQFATRPIAYKISGKSWVNNHAHVLRAKKGFNQDTIFYSLLHKNILPFIVGGTRSKLNQAELRSITIQLPKREGEQDHIAIVLSCIDRAIDQTEALIAKQQRIKTGLMQDLLTNGIDERGNIRSQSTHEFKDSPLGRIPKEWDTKDLERLCKAPIRDFGSFSSTREITFLDEGIPFIKSEMVEEGRISWTNCSYISEEVHHKLKKSHVTKGLILLSKIGSALGKAALYQGERGACNSNAAVAKIDINETEADCYFVTSLLNSELVQKQLKNMIVSLLPRLNLGDINRIHLPVPPIDEQKIISEKLCGLERTMRSERAFRSKLLKIKTGLMRDLLTGQISVENLLGDSTAVNR